MIKSFFLTFLFMLLCVSNHAQKHDDIWLFGYESYTNTECFGGSVLDFSTNPVDSFYEYREMNLAQTNASICDTAGNLLFYTNGISVANALHGIMENGEGLNPGEHANSHQVSGYILDQGAVILPKPENPHLYYLFHADKEAPIDNIDWSSRKFYYTLIDMSLNNGLGEVVEKNVILLDELLAVGKITATKHSNGKDWWILIRKYMSNEYYRFLLTSDGVLNIGKQEMGEPLESGVGQAVFSPNGKKYARYNVASIVDGNNLSIYDFDRCTGLLDNPRHTILLDSAWAGGAAISPNSRFLYVSSYNYIYQYDLEAEDILSTKDTVAIYDGYLEEVAPTIHIPTPFFLMQLAPDGKIYINLPAALKVLHVINQPNEQGEACDVAQHSVRLPTFNAFSLPNFPNYRLGLEEGVVCDSMVTTTEQVLVEPQSINVFPNPTKRKLTIKFSNELAFNTLFNIHDLTGKLIKSCLLVKGATNHTIDMSQLDSGIYFYECSSEKGSNDKGKIILIE